MILEFELRHIYTSTEGTAPAFDETPFSIKGICRKGLSKGIIDLEGEYTELLHKANLMRIEFI